jgi:hypothetical protein
LFVDELGAFLKYPGVLHRNDVAIYGEWLDKLEHDGKLENVCFVDDN